MSFPRIWVIPGNRPGDDAQVFALAEELGLPFETRKLIYNPSFWPGAGLTGVFDARSVASANVAPPFVER